MPITRATIYFDRSDPSTPGWAWKYTDSLHGDRSGPVDGDLDESATLEDVLFEAASDLPEIAHPFGGWTTVEHDGPGWEWR